MTHGSLFSGIGGFDLAAHWMGWDNIFHCEWNEFGQKVLKHHFPKSKSYNDITKTDFSIHRGEIDILTGGFPCQPYSMAGKRLGKADERHLFPEMLRAIKEIKPRWIIGENVRGLVSWAGGLVFEEVCSDLESEGYEVQPFLIPAAGVNAPHQRYRIWFVAYCNDKKQWGKNNNNGEWSIEKQEPYNRNELRNNTWSVSESKDATNTTSIRQESKMAFGKLERNKRFRFGNEFNKWDSFPSQSPLCGGDDGLPKELDNITFPKWRNESIKGYGNAIVPQVAYELFKTIELFENA